MFSYSILALFHIIALTTACQSMNGISRKAVLLGLDRNGRPREQQDTKVIPPSTTESSSEEIPSDFPVFIETSSGSQLIPLNVSYDQLRKTLETLEEIHKDSRKVYNLTSSMHNNETSQANSIQWFYPRQRNTSKPVLIQSLTKSNAYVDLNYVKISGLNSSSSGPAATAASLVNKTITLVGEENPEALFLRIFNTSDTRAPNASDTMAKAIAAKLLQQSTTTTTPAPKQLPPMVAIPPPPRAASDGPDGAEDEELDEDERARQEWGGECTVADWKSCYNITVMGLPTKVHPLYPNDRKKNIRTQLNCFDTNEALDFPWLCLRNRWTVNRCHILCMSKCNREYLYTRKWDFYVLHEGACKTK